MLASKVCELSHESRLGFGSVFGESWEKIVSVTPALLGIIEPIELYEAVNLLRDRSLQVPNVVVVIPKLL